MAKVEDVTDISECDVSDMSVCDKCEKNSVCPHYTQAKNNILYELRKKDREWAEGTFFWWEYGW